MGPSSPVASPNDCCIKCQATPNCLAFTVNLFGTGARQCWLKSAISQVQPNGNALTGINLPRFN